MRGCRRWIARGEGGEGGEGRGLEGEEKWHEADEEAYRMRKKTSGEGKYEREGVEKDKKDEEGRGCPD